MGGRRGDGGQAGQAERCSSEEWRRNGGLDGRGESRGGGSQEGSTSVTLNLLRLKGLDAGELASGGRGRGLPEGSTPQTPLLPLLLLT